VLQAALQAAWAEILVETASSFHGLDSPSKAALSLVNSCSSYGSPNENEYSILVITVDSPKIKVIFLVVVQLGSDQHPKPNCLFQIGASRGAAICYYPSHSPINAQPFCCP
jgi:hypothetical protein